MKRLSLKFIVCLGLALCVASVHAATQYWDTNGSTVGNDTSTGAGLGGTGNWSTAVANWWDGSSGTLAGWTEGNDAVFFGTAGVVTLSGPRTANSLTFKTGGYLINASTLTLTGSAIFDVQTGTSTNAPILAGTAGYTKNGDGTLVVANAGNTITGPVAINAGILELTNSSVVGGTGTGSGDITINGGTLRNTTLSAAGALVTANRSIIIGPSGGAINIPNTFGSQILLYSGNISGSGNTLTVNGPGEIRVTTNSTILTGGRNTFGKLVIDGAMFTLGQSVTGAAENSLGAVPSVTTDDAIMLRNGGRLRGNVYPITLDSKRGITLGPGGGVIRSVNSASTLVIPSAIKGPGNPLTIGTTDTGTVAIGNPANSFGNVTILTGTLRLDASGVIPDSSSVTVAGGTLSLNGFSETVATLILTNGTISGAGTLTGSSYDVRNGTVSSILGGNGNLTKTTAGTVTLSGANSYSGATTVSAGKLATTTASTGAGGYAVADNAALSVKVASAGASLNVSDLTLGNSCTNEFDLASLGLPGSGVINAAGNMTVNGTVVLNLRGFDSTGQPTLLQYAGTRSGIGSFALGTLPPRVTGSIIDDLVNKKVSLDATADSLVWVSDSTGTWNVNAAANTIWKLANAATATFYQENSMQGDTVRFDDTATGTTTATLPATVSPFKATLDNSAQNYTFTGVGKISGGASLSKSGTGQLTILTTNDFTGGTTLNAGTITIGNNSPLGTGKLTINGGAIRSDSATARTLSVPVDLNGNVTLGDAVNTGAVTFSTGAWNILGGTRQITVDTSSVTISSVVGGAGLTKAGTGTLNLTGANTFTGSVNVDAGVLAATVATALGTTAGNTVVASGAALQTSTTAAIAENITLNGTGISGAGALRHTANNKTLSGAITLGSSGVRINCDANTLTLTGGISGSGNPDLFMGGAGGITVNTTPINIGSGTFTWDTSLLTLRLDTANTMGAFNYNSGIVKFNSDTAAGQGAITVGPAATEFSVTGGFFPVLANNIVLTSGANPQFYAASGGLLTLNGIISGPGAAQRRDTGAVNPVLNGANIFAGGFLVTSRGVTLGNKSALGTGTFSIGEVATTPQTAISIAANQDLTGINAITNPIAITQNFTLSGTNDLEFSGPVTLANLTPAITVSSTAATILSGLIGGPGFGVTKAGTGTLTLRGANTYDGGTTISNGTLQVNNGSGSGTGPGAVTVWSVGTLAGGGSVSGTVALSGGVAPGGSVGTLTTGSETWNGGGSYNWELINVNGAAGSGWDLLSVNGGVDIQATSGSKFTIKVLSLNGAGAAGSVTNLDNDSTYTWGPIVTTTDSATNYDAGKFTVDFSSVSNDLAGGEFVMEPGSVSVRFTNNHAPVASTALFSRPRDTTLKITIADLLASSTSDPDGDARALAAVATSSTNGVSNVTSDATFIYYTPGTNGNVTDAFSYTVRDVRAAYRAGDTVRQASATIVVSIAPDSTNQTQNIIGIVTNLDGNVKINFAGIPGRNYLVQAATNLAPPVLWQTLSTNAAGTNGLWSFTDLEATNYTQRYYRSAKP